MTTRQAPNTMDLLWCAQLWGVWLEARVLGTSPQALPPGAPTPLPPTLEGHTQHTLHVVHTGKRMLYFWWVVKGLCGEGRKGEGLCGSGGRGAGSIVGERGEVWCVCGREEINYLRSVHNECGAEGVWWGWCPWVTIQMA